MGKTAYSGPVYGAKSLLHTCRVHELSSGAASDGISTVVSAAIVPAGEDWLATGFNVFRGSTGSTTFGASVLANSTVLSSVTFGSSLAGQNTYNTITPDGGEYEGARIASGSTVFFRIAMSSGGGISSNVTISLYGYMRFVSSTRAE